MVNVILLDDDKIFFANIAAALNSRTNIFTCSYINELKQETINLATNNKENTILIYDPSKYPLDIEFNWKIYLCSDLETSTNSNNKIYKFSKISQYLKIIEEFISNNPDLINISVGNGLACITGNASIKQIEIAISDFATKKSVNGLKPIRLDLTPPYLLSYQNYSNGNNTLTDALLRIIADDLNPESIGEYLIPEKDGVLAFRPFEKTDDLYECTPLNMQAFIEVLIEWIKITNYSYYIIINCSLIPFYQTYTIGVMCDELIILNEKDSPFQNARFNKELSHLVANLPNSCKVSTENL